MKLLLVMAMLPFFVNAQEQLLGHTRSFVFDVITGGDLPWTNVKTGIDYDRGYLYDSYRGADKQVQTFYFNDTDQCIEIVETISSYSDYSLLMEYQRLNGAFASLSERSWKSRDGKIHIVMDIRADSYTIKFRKFE